MNFYKFKNHYLVTNSLASIYYASISPDSNGAI